MREGFAIVIPSYGPNGSLPGCEAALRYVCHAVGIMAVSYALTRLFWNPLPGVPVPWTKAVVDLVLFLASFPVQRMAIFRQRNS